MATRHTLEARMLPDRPKHIIWSIATLSSCNCDPSWNCLHCTSQSATRNTSLDQLRPSTHEDPELMKLHLSNGNPKLRPSTHGLALLILIKCDPQLMKLHTAWTQLEPIWSIATLNSCNCDLELMDLRPSSKFPPRLQRWSEVNSSKLR